MRDAKRCEAVRTKKAAPELLLQILPEALNARTSDKPMLQTAKLSLPHGTSGPAPGRPVSQYGGSTGAEELSLVKLFNNIEGFVVCQQGGVGGSGSI